MTSITIGETELELLRGNIVAQDVDAIVNAANKGLSGGGGVDGAIHRAGGPEIMEACRKIGGCPTGQAVITGAGNLKIGYVIHAVGPFYNNGKSGEAELLASAYRNSLKVAVENGLESIAFPSLSTGAYRYPTRDAAEIALQTVITFLATQMHELKVVRFVLFDDKTLATYEAALNRLL